MGSGYSFQQNPQSQLTHFSEVHVVNGGAFDWDLIDSEAEILPQF